MILKITFILLGLTIITAIVCAIYSIFNTREEGEWVEVASYPALDQYVYKCSKCGNYLCYKTNFCSRCGADMRESNKENKKC